MAFEMANAEQTPLPLPDMSSPSNNFANLSFIISNSAQFIGRRVNKFSFTPVLVHQVA